MIIYTESYGMIWNLPFIAGRQTPYTIEIYTLRYTLYRLYIAMIWPAVLRIALWEKSAYDAVYCAILERFLSVLWDRKR